MKKTLLSLAVLAACGSAIASTTRARTRDVAFTFRMGAGFPGDINRSHPFSVKPGLMNVANPVRLYGHPVVIESNSYRGFLVGDTALTKIAGVLVRPYPVQQTTGGMSASIGAAVPPVTGVVDILEDGFIMVKCENFAAQPPALGGAVFVRTAATAGLLVQGGFHAADDTTNAIQVTNAEWNGPADASGVAELRVWKA